MRTGVGRDFESSAPDGRCWVAAGVFFAPKPRISRSAATRLLCIEHPPSDQVQIGKSRRDFQTMQILGKSPIAHLAEAEDILHHPEHVLDLGSNARLGTVRSLDAFIDPTAPSIPLVGEVPRARCRRAHRLFLSAIGLVAPDPSLPA